MFCDVIWFLSNSLGDRKLLIFESNSNTGIPKFMWQFWKFHVTNQYISWLFLPQSHFKRAISCLSCGGMFFKQMICALHKKNPKSLHTHPSFVCVCFSNPSKREFWTKSRHVLHQSSGNKILPLIYSTWTWNFYLLLIYIVAKSLASVTDTNSPFLIKAKNISFPMWK
jgi:hypothetical protein